MLTDNAKEILKEFKIMGSVTKCEPYGNGHINDTFLVCCDISGKIKRYILQRMNRNVFKNPEEVMSNIERVTDFLRRNTLDKRTVMSLVPTKNDKCFTVDGSGEYWRLYDFIESSLCLEKPETKDDFYQCAIAFGRFQQNLSNFPAKELYETIPDFHNTSKRYLDFLLAVEKDVCGRASGVQKEIEFIKEREAFYSLLNDLNKAGTLPLRVTHNDTKINNVMLDSATRTALCVIDLDTVMPGFSVTDFGDAIRFGANTAAEDEPDVSKVRLDLELFDIYAKGYIEGCGGALSKEEIMLLPDGAKMMTIECGMRFLTDYLNGDTYFKIKYPEHNLVRCRTQLKLVYEMENHWEEAKKITKKYLLQKL